MLSPVPLAPRLSYLDENVSGMNNYKLHVHTENTVVNVAALCISISDIYPTKMRVFIFKR